MHQKKAKQSKQVKHKQKQQLRRLMNSFLYSTQQLLCPGNDS